MNGSLLSGILPAADWQPDWVFRPTVISAVTSSKLLESDGLLDGGSLKTSAFTVPILLLCGVVAVLFLIGKYHTGYWRRRNVPCVPAGLPFVGHIPYAATTTYGMFVSLVSNYGKWTQQLGKYFGFQEGWNNVLVISDPALIEQVYVQQFDCFHIRRELGAHIFNREAGKNLIGLNGPEWKHQRNSALRAFSRKELAEKFLPMVNSSVASVIRSVKMGTSSEGDLLNVMHDCNWHLMARLALISVLRTHGKITDEAGQCWDQLEHKYAGQMEKWAVMAKKLERGHIDTMTDRHNSILYSAIYVLCMCLPWLSYKLQPIVNKYVLGKERVEERAPFRALCHSIEFDLFACTECEKIQQLDASGGEMDLAKLLYQNVVLSIGFRSIGCSLYRMCEQLTRKPAVQAKLRAEIRSLENFENPSYKQLDELAYLDAAVREALRVEPMEAQYNAVMDRICTRDCTLRASDGQRLHIDAGTWVKADIFSLHEDKLVFGADADQFNPDRWLNMESEAEKRRFNAAWLSFGAGRRVCVAQRLNMIQLKATLVAFLRQFNVTYDAKEGKPVLGDIRETEDPEALLPLKPRFQRLPVTYEACASFKVYCGGPGV